MIFFQCPFFKLLMAYTLQLLCIQSRVTTLAELLCPGCLHPPSVVDAGPAAVPGRQEDGRTPGVSLL